MTAAQGLARVALLDGWHQPDGARMAAIEITLAPGWHTYWRNPGDTGLPTTLAWTLPDGMLIAISRLPSPQVVM